MVLGHIGRGHQYHRLAQQAELGDGACAGTGDDQVGSRVCSIHATDEVAHMHVRQLTATQLSGNQLVVVLARLPDKLHVGLPKGVPRLQHTLIERTGTEATTHDEDGLLRGVEAEGAHSIVVRNGSLQEVLPHGITRKLDLLFREETLHALVGHADAVGLLGQQLVGDTGVGVLLLQQRGNAHRTGLLECRTARITTHAHSYVRTEIADDTACLAAALHQTPQHGNILEQVLAVEAAHRQTDDTVSCSRHALHLHTILGTHEEYLGIGTLSLHGIGN